ncbi:NrfD/PsrC family molybdoenzyme membrane anchor subunit [Sphingosinithalassobacter sp. LHW66-3]|uniref:NrfD/PsrC family molybdoenzyme membrane anchor subunit n=1 Tax=Sphingosinithalassobacter sp. LHW66-3 TaxID=3424718 RepID=UPI003D6C1BF3
MTEDRIHVRRADALASMPLAERYGWRWRLAIAAAGLCTLLLIPGLGLPLVAGIGVWGNNIPFVWGFDLANYGWWIGIANGAALFAALLVLWRAPLRVATNRLAETLALAAAVCAGLYPVFHLGKPWLAWWMAPVPQQTGLWPQPMSPLTWDFWAILAYLSTIALFWYIGMLPDLARLRDQARTRRTARLYGVAALGWYGSQRQWALQQRAYRVIALSVIPFLFVMQTIVSLELAITIVPDWHDTGLPVRMVVNGFASGLGMVLFVSATFGRTLQVTEGGRDGVLDRLGRLVLATALIAAFVIALTTLIEWLGPEGSGTVRRWTSGTGAWLTWASVGLVTLVPQLLWFEPVRRSRLFAALIGLGIAAGVWIDHFVVIVLGLSEDRLIAPPNLYRPNWAEVALLAGTIGLFALLLLLAARIVPLIARYHVRGEEVPE